MLGTETKSRHKLQCGVVVEEVRAQGEVAGSNTVGRVDVNFTRKMSEMGGRWQVGASTV